MSRLVKTWQKLSNQHAHNDVALDRTLQNYARQRRYRMAQVNQDLLDTWQTLKDIHECPSEDSRLAKKYLGQGDKSQEEKLRDILPLLRSKTFEKTQKELTLARQRTEMALYLNTKGQGDDLTASYLELPHVSTSESFIFATIKPKQPPKVGIITDTSDWGSRAGSRLKKWTSHADLPQDGKKHQDGTLRKWSSAIAMPLVAVPEVNDSAENAPTGSKQETVKLPKVVNIDLNLPPSRNESVMTEYMRIKRKRRQKLPPLEERIKHFYNNVEEFVTREERAKKRKEEEARKKKLKEEEELRKRYNLFNPIIYDSD